MGLVLAGGVARAEDVAEPVHVRVEGSAACSDEARFFEEVRGRTSRVQNAEAGEPGRTFRVRLAADGHEGTLWIEDAGALSAPRTIAARSCEEVVDALAFIAALSVDPGAHAHAVTVSAPPVPPPPVPALPPMPVPLPTERSPVALPSAPATPATETSEPSLLPRRRSPYFVAVGAGATVTAPDPPSSSLGGRAFVELGYAARRGSAPSLRVSFDLPGTTTIRPIGGGEATLTWVRGAIDVCPWRLPLTSFLDAAPCAGIEAGSLSGIATGIVDARHTIEPWVAGFAEGRLRVGFLRVFFAEIDLGLTVPFTRQELVFDPSSTVYEPPAALVRGMVAAGLRFP